MKATKTEFHLGSNSYGQPINLIHRRDSGGVMVWEIHQLPANQMDDQTWISGLTREMILQMADAVKGLTP